MALIKRVTRQTIAEKGKAREMCFEYDSKVGHLFVWPKGIRKKIPVNLGAVWQNGMAEEVRQTKSKKRRRRRSL